MKTMVCAIVLLCLATFAKAASNSSNEEPGQPVITFLDDDDTSSNSSQIDLENRSTEIDETATALEDLTRRDKPEDLKDNFDSRRFLTWLKDWLKTPTNRATTESTPVETKIAPLVVQKYLITVLSNLTQAIEKLNKNLDTFKGLSVIPLRYTRSNVGHDYSDLATDRRHKRDVSARKTKIINEESINATVADKIQDSNITVIKNVMASPEEATVNNTTSSTKTTTAPPNSTEDEIDKCQATRRSEQHSNPEVRKKLLTYTEDTFKDITNKIASVKKIKYEYVNNEYYKIGYIIANIDTLETNIANLKNDLDKHKDTWDESKLISLFDKLIVSNKVVGTLVDSLNIMEMKKNRDRANHMQTIQMAQKEHQIIPLFRNL